MKIKVYRWLEIFFHWLSKWAESREWQFAICLDYGRNRYYGKPCKGVTSFENHGGK